MKYQDSREITDLDDRILFEGEDLLVVDKPYGIPTSGKSLDDDDALQYWLIQRHGSMVWAVHQLDADTTGVNIFVTRRKLVGTYQKALADRNTTKRYYALVYGVPTWEEKLCQEPIGYVDRRSLGVTPQGKPAESYFRVIHSGEHFSLIEATIRTGRTHQIRIHLSHLGHSLVGEEWYRESPCQLHKRQALHAYEVNFEQSISGKFHAPLAEDFISLSKRLDISIPDSIVSG